MVPIVMTHSYVRVFLHGVFVCVSIGQAQNGLAWVAGTNLAIVCCAFIVLLLRAGAFDIQDEEEYLRQVRRCRHCCARFVCGCCSGCAARYKNNQNDNPEVGLQTTSEFDSYGGDKMVTNHTYAEWDKDESHGSSLSAGPDENWTGGHESLEDEPEPSILVPSTLSTRYEREAPSVVTTNASHNEIPFTTAWAPRMVLPTDRGQNEDNPNTTGATDKVDIGPVSEIALQGASTVLRIPVLPLHNPEEEDDDAPKGATAVAAAAHSEARAARYFL